MINGFFRGTDASDLQKVWRLLTLSGWQVSRIKGLCSFYLKMRGSETRVFKNEGAEKCRSNQEIVRGVSVRREYDTKSTDKEEVEVQKH